MYNVVFVTAADKKEAEKIARAILKKKLAACVNIIDKVQSYFWWKGKIDHAKEVLLIIKTRKPLLEKLIKEIRALHSYDVPEIIALTINSGNKKYLDWIDGSTG